MTSYVALGYSCNHNCITCPIDQSNKENKSLTLNDVESILQLNPDTNINHVIISGGEPTLSPIFLDVLSYLTKHNIDITLLSNSESFSNNDFVSEMLKIIDLEHFRVITAIHSFKKDIHELITQKSGSFDKSISGLNNLINSNIQITIKHIICRLNYCDLDNFAQFICDSFPISVPIEFCSMDYCGNAYKNANILYVHFDEIRPYLESALDSIERIDQNKRYIYITETPLCAIDPYYWRYYPLRENSQLEYYVAPNVSNNNRSLQNISSQCGTYYSECSSCIVKNICSGVWKSAYDLQTHQLLYKFGNK